MRRFALLALAVVVILLLAAAFALRSPSVQDGLVRAVLARAVASAGPDLFGEDALRAVLCGTSSPLPHPTRAKPCTAVFAAGRFWIVDAGPGSWNRLALWRVPGERIGAVLLTHFHSDHIGELGEFDLQTWVAGRPDPLRVFGPAGVEQVVAGFEAAYALDTRYRIEHHGAELLPEAAGRMVARPVALPDDASSPVPVLAEDGLRITALAVDHRPVVPALAYRFEYGGRSLVLSGDTAPHEPLVEFARGADLLIHEAQADPLVAMIGEAAAAAGRDRIAKIMSDIPDYHTPPTEAARIANRAGVGLLVLTHLTPPPPNALVERIYTRDVPAVRPEGWVLADDGLRIDLPLGSDAIEIGEME